MDDVRVEVTSRPPQSSNLTETETCVSRETDSGLPALRRCGGDEPLDLGVIEYADLRLVALARLLGVGESVRPVT